MKDHLRDQPQQASWRRLAAASCAAGLTLGLGSAAAAGASASAAAATGCQPEDGAVVRTLRLKIPTQTVTAHVGDTIRVIVHMKGEQADAPKPLDHKHAVCRISVHRMSRSKVIAKFRVLKASKEKINFGAEGVPRCPPPPKTGPIPHSCHPIFWTGYVKVGS